MKCLPWVGFHGTPCPSRFFYHLNIFSQANVILPSGILVEEHTMPLPNAILEFRIIPVDEYLQRRELSMPTLLQVPRQEQKPETARCGRPVNPPAQALLAM